MTTRFELPDHAWIQRLPPAPPRPPAPRPKSKVNSKVKSKVNWVAVFAIVILSVLAYAVGEFLGRINSQKRAASQDIHYEYR